ncbi:MAG: magnesium transporter [Rickettsiaceae bacterium]
MVHVNDETINYDSRLTQNVDRIVSLIENKELEQIKNLLINMHYADLADVLDNINTKTAQLIIPIIIDSINPETLICINSHTQQGLIQIVGTAKITSMLNAIDTEDVIEIVSNINNDLLKQTLIEGLSEDKQLQIKEGLNYPEDSVGRIIEKSFLSCQEHWTVKQTIDYINNSDLDDDLHAIVVVNNRYKPIGTISLNSLLKNKATAKIKDIMNIDIEVISATAKINDAVFIFKQYELTIVPVINKIGKLIGIVSINNMIYIIDKQVEKEILPVSGIYFEESFYSVFSIVRQRLPWLLINLITASSVALIINNFSQITMNVLYVAAMMTIIAAVGGNAAIQVIAVTVRAINNKHINNYNKFKVILKEIIASAFNGILLASIVTAITMIGIGNTALSLVFACSIFSIVVIAGVLGSSVPIILNYFKIDPATASGIFVTAFTDALAFFIFLGLSYIFLFS